MYSYFMKLRGLKDIVRCNTQRRIRDLDVAQHSFYTALLAMMVADELSAKGYELNKELVLKKALLHDIEETYTGDIIYPVKHYDEATHKAIAEVARRMGDDFYAELDKGTERYRNVADTAKEGLEGEIVAVCDMTELMVYCFEEVSLGNVNMLDLFHKAATLVKKYRLYEESSVLQKLLNYCVTQKRRIHDN